MFECVLLNHVNTDEWIWIKYNTQFFQRYFRVMYLDLILISTRTKSRTVI